ACWEGGRNSLLESAQEATPLSVAISAIQRQLSATRGRASVWWNHPTGAEAQHDFLAVCGTIEIVPFQNGFKPRHYRFAGADTVWHCRREAECDWKRHGWTV
ncbi:MAG: hypothetical protein WB763_18360, partial [Terriglobia bacterium]